MTRRLRRAALLLWRCLLAAALCVALGLPARGVETILRVGVQPGLPPYQFVEDGRLRGLHIELLDRIAARNSYRLEYVPFDTPEQCMQALDRGEIDLVLGNMLNEHSEHRAQFTSEISQSSICMIAPKHRVDAIRSKTGIEGDITAVEQDTIGYSFMYSLGALTYMVVPDQNAVFAALDSGRADIAVGVKSSMLYLIERSAQNDRYTVVYNYMAPIEYTIAVAEGDPQLLGELNDAIESLRVSGEYDLLFDRWVLTGEERYPVAAALRRYWYVPAALALLIAAVILGNMRVNMLLKRQVAEKTAAIAAANDALTRQIRQMQDDAALRSQILETSPAGMLLIDDEARVLLCNRSACRILGREAVAVGEPASSMELCRIILEDKRPALREGQRFINQALRLPGIAGQETCYQYSLLPLTEYSRPGGAILILEDVTQKVRDTEAILEREKSRVLNQLVAGIAHEIKNPLTSIKTIAQLIRRKKDSPQLQESIADIVPREVDRINRLVESLIDYARPHKAVQSRFSVEELVDSCMFFIDAMKTQFPIEVSCKVEPGLTLTADPHQIKQALLNILLNGLESLQERQRRPGAPPPVLRIAAHRTAGGVRMVVTDNGVGMSPEEIARAAEPFFTTKETGTGMGLAVTSQFVGENGGVITIDSQKDRYTTITLLFGEAL